MPSCSNDSARMHIQRGATYRRQVTWTGQTGAPSDYDAVLIMRKTLSTVLPTLTMDAPAVGGNGITIAGGSGSPITTTLRLGDDITPTFGVGNYVATLALSLVADPTENWTVTWPVTITATALQVSA